MSAEKELRSLLREHAETSANGSVSPFLDLAQRLQKQLDNLEKEGFRPRTNSMTSAEWLYRHAQDDSYVRLTITQYADDFGFRIEAYDNLKSNESRGGFKYTQEVEDVGFNHGVEVARKYIEQALYIKNKVFEAFRPLTK